MATISRDEAVNLTIKELESLQKELRAQINKIDDIIYGEDNQFANMTASRRNKMLEEYADKRYELSKNLGTVNNVYRKKRLHSLQNYNSKILAYGAYTDCHTDLQARSGKFHHKALSGITL